MLDKHYDMALVGKSYLSTLLSLSLLKRKQTVLLLDDDRLRFGELFTNTLYLIEKKFLETWGKDEGIRPLMDLDKYLVNRPLNLILGNKRIRLGDKPSRNLTELMRKFPNCFRNEEGELLYAQLSDPDDAKEFNEAFINYCTRIGQNAYRYNDMRSFNSKAFLTHCPERIKTLFEHFCSSLFAKEERDEGDMWTLRTFLYMTRGHYQKRPSISGSDFELFHLFICLLSPHYELDHDLLMKDLIDVHCERGGRFKTTQVREWKFYKGKPWSLELASYEGIIHPNKISFLGGAPVGMPIKLESQVRTYHGLKVEWTFNKEFHSGWANEKVLFSSLEKIGTARPMWEATFSKRQATFLAFITGEKGVKIEFIQKEVSKMLEKDLKHIMPEFDGSLIEEKMRFSEELWIQEEKITSVHRTGDLPLPKNINVLDCSVPGKQNRLKNVYYFGPYKEGPLGLLSSLMEIKDTQQFL